MRRRTFLTTLPAGALLAGAGAAPPPARLPQAHPLPASVEGAVNPIRAVRSAGYSLDLGG